MKDLRELEAQHEATVPKSTKDDQKLRMHSEFKAICFTDEAKQRYEIILHNIETHPSRG